MAGLRDQLKLDQGSNGRMGVVGVKTPRQRWYNDELE